MTLTEQLCAIYSRRGAGAYFGEVVSTLEHSLQTAYFAQEANASDALVVAALLHDKRSPIINPALVIGIFHAVVAMVCGHRIEPFLEERNIFRTSNKTHVRNRMDEGLRILDRTLFNQIRPQLAR